MFANLTAYVLGTSEVLWEVGGKLLDMKGELCPLSVTCDGRGHMFVCDGGNDCVQLFSAADGRYLGPVLREELLDPVSVRWSEETASLLVTHSVDDQRCLSAVTVSYE